MTPTRINPKPFWVILKISIIILGLGNPVSFVIKLQARLIRVIVTPLKRPIRILMEEVLLPKGRKLVTNSKGVKYIVRPNGGKSRACKAEGCSKIAVSQVLCISHGGSLPRCTYSGCKNQATKNKLCNRHGGGAGKCKVEGCEKYARVNGRRCMSHGGTNPKCQVEGCKKERQGPKFCIRHGGIKRLCKTPGCSKYAKGKGMCISHGGQRTNCKICKKNQAVMGGYCYSDAPADIRKKLAKRALKRRNNNIQLKLRGNLVGEDKSCPKGKNEE